MTKILTNFLIVGKTTNYLKVGVKLKETIINNEDLLEMLDSLLREPTHFWDGFYANREKGIPFSKINQMRILWTIMTKKQ